MRLDLNDWNHSFILLAAILNKRKLKNHIIPWELNNFESQVQVALEATKNLKIEDW